MATYHINGAKPLSGTVKIGGSKNATLPIICATLLTKETCVLKNIPAISDVGHLVEILEGLGAKATQEGSTLTIDGSGVNAFNPNPDLVKKLRGSILLIGPLLARFGKIEIPFPGGDSIGARPIDSHLVALEELGATVEQEGDILKITCENLTGKKVIMTEMSVTATENIIMAAVLAKGKTSIHIAATEPHVQDLCNLLIAMGAKIQGVGTNDLYIEGVKELHGAEHTIIFDNEVACSFINLAAATKSEMTIENINPDYLSAALIQFKRMNVNLEIGDTWIKVKQPTQAYKAIKIKPNTYPGLITDYVPPFAVLATQAEGTTLVHEWMYEGRLGYIHELSKMGAKAYLLDPHRAEIKGPTKLHGNTVSSLDVRSGMVLVIAALVAEGKSVLYDVEHIERGYGNLVETLKELGADIIRYESR